MANFKVDAYNPDRTEVEQQYSLTFTDTAPAAPVAASALTSAGTITSGALPNTGAWVSGTAKVNPVARQITVNVEFVTDATNALATCAVAISADNSTFTTIGTATLAAALNNLGLAKFVMPVNLPQGWYIKVTFAQGTVAASIYY